MSVLIKGMEMPQEGKVLQVVIASDGRCYKTIYQAAMEVGSFADAVPVPDHGRLIDADALCEGLVSNHPVVIYAKSAPTIIPADKEVEQ